MISVWAVTIMLFGHWLADFVFQPDWMSKAKSKNWYTLYQHTERIYLGSLLAGLTVFWVFGGSLIGVVYWALINAAAHFGIDAVTSRITGKLYAKGDVHNFFVVIGFDQFLHLSLATGTLAWLVL